ncbi:hypothetical protein [Streptomyces mirabilis]|uniref:hypothetical protein n=1 Tax=Streptomyces mirabilis TaxID=68239 RepID=UPI0033E3206A
MSARRRIIAALSADSMGGIATLQDVAHAEQLVDAHRAEVLAEAADFVGNDDDCDCGGCDSCFPRKLADGLRALAREKATGAQSATATPVPSPLPGWLVALGTHGSETERALYAAVIARDEEIQRLTTEKATPAQGTTATPGLTTRQAWLLTAIQATGGRWKTGMVRTAYRENGFGAVGTNRVSRDLRALTAAGHLRQIDEDGVRYYLPTGGGDVL